MNAEPTSLARQRGMHLADELIHWIKSDASAGLRDEAGRPLSWELIVASAADWMTDVRREDTGLTTTEAVALRRGRELAERMTDWIRENPQIEQGLELDRDEMVAGAADYLAYVARKADPPERPPWAEGPDAGQAS